MTASPGLLAAITEAIRSVNVAVTGDYPAACAWAVLGALQARDAKVRVLLTESVEYLFPKPGVRNTDDVIREKLEAALGLLDDVAGETSNQP